jgi:hypothetical protein
MDRAAFFRDCVITIASDDYESFEIILNDTEKIASERGLKISDIEVAEALRSLIADGLLEAFFLSPQKPHVTKVKYSPDRLCELWYYVTPGGKKLAKGIPFLSGESE